MTETPSTQHAETYRSAYPFATAMAIGYSFILALTVFLVLAFLATKDELLAQPPQISWKFVAVFLGGTWAFTALQLGLLYYFKEKAFWPQTPKEWLQRVGPVLPIVAAIILPGLMSAWNATIATAAITMLLGVAVGMVPTLLCFADWLKYRSQRMEDTIKLCGVENSELPLAVRSYFDAHTDELNRIGFEQLGDYRLKEYTPTYGRFFLNRERDTFAEICHARIALIPLRTVCFFSLTADGHYLESSNMRLAKRRQTRFFEIQILPRVATRDLFEQHQTRLRQLDQGQPRVLAAADLEPVMHYGNKHLYDLMIADGLVSKNPYADFDESVLVKRELAASAIGAAVFDLPVSHEATVNIS